MKRPLMKACLVYLGTLLLSSFLPKSYNVAAIVILTVVAALLFLVSIFKKPFLKIGVFVIISILTLATIAIYNKVTIEPAYALYGTEAKITGTIMTSSKHSANSRSYIVKLNTIDGNKAPRDSRIILYCKNYDVLSDYDEISANISFFEGDTISQSEKYYLSNSVVATGITMDDVTVTNEKNFSLLREICRIRDRLIFNIRTYIPNEHGDIISGILFGNRSNISDKTSDSFAAAGISHLLAVSGLHLTIIVFLLDLLLLTIGFNKITRTIISLLLTIIMMIMTGFTPSIVRAAVMTSLALIGSTIRRDYDSATAMCLSASIICFANPYAILNIGFQLSFSATTGLILTQRILEKQRRKFSMKTVAVPRLLGFEIFKLIFPCFMAFMFTIPVSSYVFGYISTYSPITNFLIAPIIPLLLAFSLLGAIFSLTGLTFIYKPILYIANLLISCVVWVAEKISELPYAKIYLPEDFYPFIIIFAVIAFAISILSKRPIKNSIAAALLCIPIACVCIISQHHINKDTIKISLVESSTPCCIVEYENRYFISGFSSDASYDISRATSHPNKRITLLSAPSLKNADISLFTNFIVQNKISCIALPKDQVSIVETLGKETVNKTFTSENFYLGFDGAKITTNVYSKNTATVISINGYKIAVVNITHPDDIPDAIECDILIANSGVVPFIDKYKCKYFILSEKLENPNYLSNSLKNKGIIYLGDARLSEIYLRGKELYKKW